LMNNRGQVIYIFPQECSLQAAETAS